MQHFITITFSQVDYIYIVQVDIKIPKLGWAILYSLAHCPATKKRDCTTRELSRIMITLYIFSLLYQKEQTTEVDRDIYTA